MDGWWMGKRKRIRKSDGGEEFWATGEGEE
jgi:hypothetical protein